MGKNRLFLLDHKNPRYKSGAFAASGLDPAEQDQYQQNDQNSPDDARWPVTPASGVREYRQTANEQQYQDDDKNGADAHDEFLLGEWLLQFTHLTPNA
jgi:hypothetical protein